MATRHNERCQKCKAAILALLKHIHGVAIERHGLGLPADVQGYRDTKLYGILNTIHSRLQEHRGFRKFVFAKELPAVDYYVPRPGIIVEFDESQHFTAPREITLRSYPETLRLGFARDTWISRCVRLHRSDNDPPYRDEQRAWYDALRDFAYHTQGVPLIRILPDEHVWCELDSTNEADVAWFREFIDSRLCLWRGKQA